MRRTLLLLLIFSSFFVDAQQKIKFNYDPAGNQILRYACSSCRTSENPKDIEDLVETDLQKAYPQDIISFYPNPVKEQLFIKWEIVDNNYVTEIYLYDFNGRVLFKKENLQTVNSTSLFFSSYPEGIYHAILIFQNGKQESIKIAK